MQNDLKLKKTTKRASGMLERLGYRVSFAGGQLKEVFDIAADSVYNPAFDRGMYVKICIDAATIEQVDMVRRYLTPRKKEVWVFKFGEKDTDPGTLFIMRIQDTKVVDKSLGWPVEKTKSSPQNRRVKTTKSESKLPKIEE